MSGYFSTYNIQNRYFLRTEFLSIYFIMSLPEMIILNKLLQSYLLQHTFVTILKSLQLLEFKQDTHNWATTSQRRIYPDTWYYV